MRYTHKLQKLAEQLSRLMTLLDVADLTALNWDTVKDIVKRRLRRDYGRVDLKGVRYLSIDEIYVGKRRGFYTLVMDIQSGRILWVSQGRGKAGLKGFWPRLRRSPSPHPRGGDGYERGVLGGGGGSLAGSRGGL